MKKLSQAIVLAGAMTAGLAAVHTAQAEVEVSASATVSSMYLWRGMDLGNGSPAVSGDLSVSASGAYAGVWTSSGDSSLGNEYDLYVGYGAEMGDFSVDVSVWTYVYPSANAFPYANMADDDVDAGVDTRGNTFDYSDAIISLGYAGASFTYYMPVGAESNDDYSYFTLGYGMDAYSVTLGHADDGADNDYTHLDVGYAYNDNLSFTFSKVIDQSADLDKGEEGVDEDLKVVVSYSLPISM
ncbi:TorF family putative porin [Thalassolituus sp. LLYu03]|uniref:TorF family putative porin n=1 Tax=Thalassolituus sp. LLYu03 TaxID=3421656 RepID=UPI003D265224